MIRIGDILQKINPAPLPALCAHQNVTPIPRKRMVRNGSFQNRFQCLDCGDPVGNQVSKIKTYELTSGREPEPFDEALYEAGEAKRKSEWEEWRIANDHARQSRQSDWWRTYNEYLASHEWASKRKKVINRCGGVCEGCLMWPVMHIHHLTYDNVGDELLYQLVGLCGTCHEKAHSKREVAE